MEELTPTFACASQLPSSSTVDTPSLDHSIYCQYFLGASGLQCTIRTTCICGSPCRIVVTCTMDEAERVPSRDDFKTAIICALPKEAEAVENLLSKRWKTKELGRHAGDQNMYTAGRIGDALVIVVWLDDYGRTKAASATAQLLFSFKNIEHALVVGICGGVPSPSSSQEITLGDIVISTELQQYDVGKQFPNGYRTGSRAKPRKDMRSFLHKLSTSGQTRRTLDDYLVKHLQLLLSRDAEYAAGVRYPGKHEDILHEPTYIHKHYPPSECYMCTKTETVCEVARDKPCSDLNCNTSETAKIIPRTRHQSSSNASAPKVHFGIVGSGDTVMKSAQHRDAIAEKEGIIAFEMEGAGVFEGINSIVVIKGVCDYADSHKNKKWQRYAATMAAACTGAFLELKEEEYGSEQLQRKSSHASIATMDSAVSNWSSSGNYYTSEPQLARHAIMDSGISSRSHSASNFTAGPPLSRHASDGGGIALSPHMRTANHPYHMGSPAERFREHRTQSWTSEPASYYGTPVDYGPPRNGWDSPNPMAQSRVSIPEVTSDAHLARSQTFPPQAHHQENTPTPAFPTLSTLSAHHQEDTTTPAFPTLSTLSLPDPSTAVRSSPSQQTNHSTHH